MSLLGLLLALKGGAGSGNWGHAGRPGKKGGSMPGAIMFYGKISNQGNRNYGKLDKNNVAVLFPMGSKYRIANFYDGVPAYHQDFDSRVAAISHLMASDYVQTHSEQDKNDFETLVISKGNHV